MKKLMCLLTASIAALGLCSCSGGEKKEEKAFVSLDINPDVELVVDSDNRVVDFYASNDDAKIMLHGEDSLKGMTLDAAVGEIARLSIDLGYMSEENHVLEYTISSNMSSKKLGKLEASINGSFDKEAKKANLDISCKMEPTFTLERQLNELKRKYPDNPDIQKLTEADYKLIIAAMASDFTLTLEEACKMDALELIGVIEENRDEAYNYATKAYNEIMLQADKAFMTFQSGYRSLCYNSFYVKNFKDHKVNYGLIYSTYQASRLSLEGILKGAYLVEKYTKEILTEEQITEITEAMIEAKLLVKEEINELKDANGNITMDSINAYLDKRIKNIEDEDLKASLSNLVKEVNTLEGNINALVQSIANEHKDELNAIATSLKSVVAALGGVAAAMLPDDIKAIIEAYKSELNTLANVITSGCKGEITLDNMKEYINKLEDKENEALAQINKDLSDEDKEAINVALNKQDEAYNNAKKALDEALASAKRASDKRLNDLKAELSK